MHEYEISILNLLKKEKSADPGYLQEKLGLGKDSVLWAVENLSKNGLVKVDRESRKVPVLTEEGKGYLRKFPEEELIIDIYNAGGKQTCRRDKE